MTSTIGVAMSKEVPLSDRAVMKSVRDGDRAARDALARRVGSAAYVFAVQLTGGSDTARRYRSRQRPELLSTSRSF
ncbi:MAG: hypothetical protein QNL12_01140 [Acidimicrobiia bacterium]|nr:hypothetical protein [Acidimicrobiia bacterium]MDX2465891.1 hypothetical protein [Acidimicrobiia bacterium]